MTQRISPTHTVVTVGATSTAVLVASTTREHVLLINDSDEAIYVKLGAAATMNAGIRLNASGGSYEMTRSAGNLYSGAIYAICSSGSKKLLVTEST